MLILRIKQAQTAIADGRFDHAYELVSDAKLQKHAKGQELVTDLCNKFLQRADEHLANSRIDLALSDCNKAEKLGGNLPQAGLLRKRICDSMQAKSFDEHDKNASLDQAKQHFDNGRLSVGEHIISQNAENPDAKKMLEKAAVMRMQIEKLVENVNESLDASELASALDIIGRSEFVNSDNSKYIELINKVKKQVQEQVQKHLSSGRIDLAKELFAQSVRIDAISSALSQYRNFLDDCKLAWQKIDSFDFPGACDIFRKLKLIVPQAHWLDDSIEQCRRAYESVGDLRSGPAAMAAGDSLAPEKNISEIKPVTPAKPLPRLTPEKPLVNEFILQADGVGSFLVYRDNVVTIGPVSASVRPTLGLVAGPNLPVIKIERLGSDYFASSDKPIQVNGKTYDRKLLVDTDTIILSNRCRVRFNLPNAASSTATLVITGARLIRPDINYVILMDKVILAGPQSNNHIKIQADQKVTLMEKANQLCCKTQEKVQVNDKVLNASDPLPFEATIKAGRLSFVLRNIKK